MSKQVLFSISLVVIIVTAVLTYTASTEPSKSTKRGEFDVAINQAKHVYQQRKAAGEDFSNGPCLSDALMPNWILDIAHNPRQEVDDLPQNMCPAYREGKAKHFVELDPDGNLIRAR